MVQLRLIQTKYLSFYIKALPITLLEHFNKVKAHTFVNGELEYSLARSSVYSSMIEGNNIDFDSYLKYSTSGMNTKNKSFQEIEDLKDAYEFASKHVPNQNNILNAHSILSQILLEKEYRGTIRDKNVYIFNGGVKVYTGASLEKVNSEMQKLFKDIDILRKRELSITEVFYYASMIHLVLAKIHPFADGNGRISRLVEKWFLASKLGNGAWFIQSEKLYQQLIKSYYKNVDIGKTYNTINFGLSIPFMKMLPMALRLK